MSLGYGVLKELESNGARALLGPCLIEAWAETHGLFLCLKKDPKPRSAGKKCRIIYEIVEKNRGLDSVEA